MRFITPLFDTRPSRLPALLNRLRHLAVVGIAAWLCSACALAPGMHVEVDPPRDPITEGFVLRPVTATVIQDQRRAQPVRAGAIEAQGLTLQDPSKAVREYRIGPGDVLAVIVWDHPELTSRSSDDPAPADGIEVDAKGQVFVPYAGLVEVGGLTVDELRSMLTQRLSVFAKAPQVDVRITYYRSQRIQVTGEVAQPGTVALDGTSKGVLEALAERGGLTARASRRYLHLSRGARRYDIDLDRLYGGEMGSIGPALEPGDVIRVPDNSADEVVVLGAVEDPRSVSVGGDSLSAISAVAAAGGVAKNSARGSDLYIFRAPDPATPQPAPIEVFQIDLSQPLGLVLATRFMLQPRDVVYVAATNLSRFNSVMQQFLPTLQEIFYIDRLADRDR